MKKSRKYFDIPRLAQIEEEMLRELEWCGTFQAKISRQACQARRRKGILGCSGCSGTQKLS